MNNPIFDISALNTLKNVGLLWVKSDSFNDCTLRNFRAGKNAYPRPAISDLHLVYCEMRRPREDLTKHERRRDMQGIRS